MFQFLTCKPHISVCCVLMNVQQCHISGITKKRIVKKLKPSGGRARRRTGPGLPYLRSAAEKCLSETKDDDVCLATYVHVREKSVRELNKLSFAGETFVEAMLVGVDDLVCF